jgi:hypothetical protein
MIPPRNSPNDDQRTRVSKVNRYQVTPPWKTLRVSHVSSFGCWPGMDLKDLKVLCAVQIGQLKNLVWTVGLAAHWPGS